MGKNITTEVTFLLVRRRRCLRAHGRLQQPVRRSLRTPSGGQKRETSTFRILLTVDVQINRSNLFRSSRVNMIYYQHVDIDVNFVFLCLKYFFHCYPISLLHSKCCCKSGKFLQRGIIILTHLASQGTVAHPVCLILSKLNHC